MKEQFNRLRLKFVAARHGGDVAARRMGVQVGSDCRILTLDFGTEPWLIEIGDHVTLSGGVQILTHDGSGWLMTDSLGRRYRYARVRIGSNVFIGAKAIVLAGVQIGDNCVVGAGSVLTKSLPAGSVVAGNPARLLGSFDELSSRMQNWPAQSSLEDLTYRDLVERALDHNAAPEISSTKSTPSTPPEEHNDRD